MVHSPPQVVHETHEVKVVDHAEVDRLNHIILELRNRPQEVVHETHEVKVVDHAEIDRLNAFILEQTVLHRLSTKRTRSKLKIATRSIV